MGFTSAGLGVTTENQQGYILWLQKNGLVPDTNQENITKKLRSMRLTKFDL